MPEQPPAVILLSGGLDSTTVLAIADAEGYACHCLSFDYGQKQTVELAKAEKIAARYGAKRHLILRLDLDRIGGSALTDNIVVPKDGNPEQQGTIPVTYVPARNTILLAHAVAWAEVLGAWDIFIGVNAVDYSGYPDCRPEFLAAFAHMANLGTKAGISGAAQFTIKAPLMYLSKAGDHQEGAVIGSRLQPDHSCYDPRGTKACGRCDACILRRNGFAAAGVPDPTDYL